MLRVGPYCDKADPELYDIGVLPTILGPTLYLDLHLHCPATAGSKTPRLRALPSTSQDRRYASSSSTRMDAGVYRVLATANDLNGTADSPRFLARSRVAAHTDGQRKGREAGHDEARRQSKKMIKGSESLRGLSRSL